MRAAVPIVFRTATVHYCLLTALKELVQAAVREGVSPGMQWCVVSANALLFEGAVGRYKYEPGSPSVSLNTLYDIASLTKVIAGTAMAILLWQEGRLELDRPVIDLVPEFAGPDKRREQVTLRMLLLHTSGLPDHARLWETAQSRAGIVQAACKIPLSTDPGQRTEYSDLGFIVLGEALERLAGERIDSYVRRVWEPLGLQNTLYCPPGEWKGRCPPTNAGTDFRRRVIQGEVHDENAAAMEGVSAHAGVFSTARDVAGFAQCMLRGGEGVFTREAVELFTRRQGTRALGWDIVNQPGSSAGRYFSPQSYGHLGYTGTSLWIDPEADVAVVLLTNRVWPDSKSQKIRQFRPQFHDAIRSQLLRDVR